MLFFRRMSRAGYNSPFFFIGDSVGDRSADFYLFPTIKAWSVDFVDSLFTATSSVVRHRPCGEGHRGTLFSYSAGSL
jgi:hypothetical protein